MNSNSRPLTEDEQKAILRAKELRAYIANGVSKSALRALKERFGYDLPSHIYSTQGFGVVGGQDAKLIQLHAAVRDGQREVISYIARILNSDDE
jgi:hypothetical protein